MPLPAAARTAQATAETPDCPHLGVTMMLFSTTAKRPRFRAVRLIALTLTIALAGCPGLGQRDLTEVSPHRSPGDTARATVRRGTVQSETGCRIDTTAYQPRQPRTPSPVILAHGFLRDQRRMAGLAQALADQGIPAVTLNFCNARLWDGRHVQNGRDMISVAREFGSGRVVYAGFSAGGLAALVAGRLDPNALGILTLDLVDDRGIGVGMARALDKPLIGLGGDPTACNAGNNGRAVFAASPKARLTAIPGASHCDFESPTNSLCEAVCRGLNKGSPLRRRAIIAASVTAVSDLIGLSGRRKARASRGPQPR
ncbi:MAG TPA: alpha/beta hydrolase [Lamprocystis sp. (in: g-proteobacteria)]|nr:alpha/beta hydrolase [Lamprocystis sp. (in: g-proteobacteria)]